MFSYHLLRLPMLKNHTNGLNLLKIHNYLGCTCPDYYFRELTTAAINNNDKSNKSIHLLIQSNCQNILYSHNHHSFHKNPRLLSSFQKNTSARNGPSTGGDYLSGTISSRLVNELLSPKIRPFARLMRLDKPTGTWLLLLPCWWSISLSTSNGSLPSLSLMALFGLGALMMRSAGCIINDIWDRKFDRNVERCKNRPLASEELSVSDAIVLLSGLLGSSLLILIQFDIRSIVLGMSSLLIVATYPSFKRFTYWPQVILGMAFNWGALLGWSANCNGNLDLGAVLPLYIAGICWTLIYDTIYAHQDKTDDSILGLKSTALKFGSKTPMYLNGFTALMTSCLLDVGLYTEQTWPYYLSLAMVSGFLIQINQKLDVDSVESCAKAFRKNTQIGWLLLLGIISSTLLKKEKSDDQNVESNENIGKNQSSDRN